jgi:hypothetical protein
MEAVYRDGVLYLEEQLPLSNDTKVTVTVTVEMSAEEAMTERRIIHETLVAAGLARPGPVPMPVQSILSPEREEEIAEIFAQGGPVSALILEERNER